MKYNSAQVQFFVSLIFWIGILQITALWYISTAKTFVCNSSGAWPLSGISFLGNGILTLTISVIVFWWAWKTLGEDEPRGRKYSSRAFVWAPVVATGLSHTLERLSSQCVLDYWQVSLIGKSIHFNLGDLSLTFGAVFLIVSWWLSHE